MTQQQLVVREPFRIRAAGCDRDWDYSDAVTDLAILEDISQARTRGEWQRVAFAYAVLSLRATERAAANMVNR